MSTFEERYYEHENFWGPSSGLHNDENLTRYRRLAGLIPGDASSILDVGCGNGIFCSIVNETRPEMRVVGLDRSLTALQYVKVEKVEGDISEIPFLERTFSCVSCLEVLEHLPIPTYRRACSELARVADKYLLVSVPNKQDLSAGLTRCSACMTMFDPDLHLRSYGDVDLNTLFDSAGFTCQTLLPLGPYSVYRGLDGYFAWRRGMAKRRAAAPAAMASPLCPVCGHVNEDYGKGSADPSIAHRASRFDVLATLKRMVKSRWPTEERSRWLAALYVRQ